MQLNPTTKISKRKYVTVIGKNIEPPKPQTDRQWFLQQLAIIDAPKVKKGFKSDKWQKYVEPQPKKRLSSIDRLRALARMEHQNTEVEEFKYFKEQE